MQVAVDVDGGVRHAVVDEVVARGHGELPVGCQAHVAADADALYGLVLEVHLAGHIVAHMAEGVADADVPRHREVDITAHHHRGAVVVGCLQERVDGVSLALLPVALEGVVVEVKGELCAPGGVLCAEEAPFSGPEELVAQVAEGVDDVGAEGAAVVEHEGAEERGAAGDGEVAEVEGVLGEVVVAAEGEVLEEGDLLDLGGGVEGVLHLDFEVVAKREAELAAAAVGRAAVEALLEDGVAVHVARVVGILLPVAELVAAEVGAVGEAQRGVDDVAQSLQGAVLELEHAVDARGERRGEAEVAVGAEAAYGVGVEGVGGVVEGVLYGAPVPALMVGERVGPVEELEHLDAAADGYGVLHAVLHAV